MANSEIEDWLRAMPGAGHQFSTEPRHLYRPADIYRGFDPGRAGSLKDAFDTKVTFWLTRGAYAARKLDIAETVAARLHDTAIDRLSATLVKANRPSVALMGSHSIPRGSPAFLQFAEIARGLRRRGYLVVSGGGPGLMEAANLGAFVATCDDDVLPAAIEMLSPVQTFSDNEGWVRTAALARGMILSRMPGGRPDARWDDDAPKDVESLGIPTWYYGTEPPNLFATHIAKYFFNSLREDGLVSVGTAGIVFGMGDAGTVQEIFQNASLNYYPPAGKTATPMVFVGKAFWNPPADPTQTGDSTDKRPKPVLPLVRALAAQAGKPFSNDVDVFDTVDEVIAAIVDGTPADGAAGHVAEAKLGVH